MGPRFGCVFTFDLPMLLKSMNRTSVSIIVLKGYPFFFRAASSLLPIFRDEQCGGATVDFTGQRYHDCSKVSNEVALKDLCAMAVFAMGSYRMVAGILHKIPTFTGVGFVVVSGDGSIELLTHGRHSLMMSAADKIYDGIVSFFKEDSVKNNHQVFDVSLVTEVEMMKNTHQVFDKCFKCTLKKRTALGGVDENAEAFHKNQDNVITLDFFATIMNGRHPLMLPLRLSSDCKLGLGRNTCIDTFDVEGRVHVGTRLVMNGEQGFKNLKRVGAQLWFADNTVGKFDTLPAQDSTHSAENKEDIMNDFGFWPQYMGMQIVSMIVHISSYRLGLFPTGLMSTSSDQLEGTRDGGHSRVLMLHLGIDKVMEVIPQIYTEEQLALNSGDVWFFNYQRQAGEIEEQSSKTNGKSVLSIYITIYPIDVVIACLMRTRLDLLKEAMFGFFGVFDNEDGISFGNTKLSVELELVEELLFVAEKGIGVGALLVFDAVAAEMANGRQKIGFSEIGKAFGMDQKAVGAGHSRVGITMDEINTGLIWAKDIVRKRFRAANILRACEIVKVHHVPKINIKKICVIVLNGKWNYGMVQDIAIKCVMTGFCHLVLVLVGEVASRGFQRVARPRKGSLKGYYNADPQGFILGGFVMNLCPYAEIGGFDMQGTPNIKYQVRNAGYGTDVTGHCVAAGIRSAGADNGFRVSTEHKMYETKCEVTGGVYTGNAQMHIFSICICFKPKLVARLLGCEPGGSTYF